MDWIWITYCVVLLLSYPLYLWLLKKLQWLEGWDSTFQGRKASAAFIAVLSDIILEKKCPSLKNDLSKLQLPKYKYFTEVVEALLKISQNFGGPIAEFLDQIRNGVYQDDRFERKVRKELEGALIQMMILAGITWVFIFLANELAGIQLPHSVYFIMGGIQIIGFIVFLTGHLLLKSKVFSGFSLFFQSLYSFYSLYSVGVPLNVAVSKSELTIALQRSERKFKTPQKYLNRLLRTVQATGVSISTELGMVIDELWFTLEHSFAEYVKQVMALKLVVLTLFFLGSYFYFLAQLFVYLMSSF